MFGLQIDHSNSTSCQWELIFPRMKKDQTDKMGILNDVYIANKMKLSVTYSNVSCQRISIKILQNIILKNHLNEI